MATDRIVLFLPTNNIEKRTVNTLPTRERVAQIIAGYFGKAADIEDSSGHTTGVWFVNLNNPTSQECDWFRKEPREPNPDIEVTERWIEVILNDGLREFHYPVGKLNVLTRSQDPFTMAVADGLVRAIVRHTKGQRLDTGD